MADGRVDDRRGVLRWGPVCAAGAVAGYPVVLPANPRHFYTDTDTEYRYAPLRVMTGRSLGAGKFPGPMPDYRQAGNHAIEEAGLLDPPQAELEHPWRAAAGEIGGAAAAWVLGPALLQIARLRGLRRSGLLPTEPETGKPDPAAAQL